MSHRTLTILVLVFMLATAIGVPVAWQEYEQARAAQKIPEILRIANSITLPDDAVLVREYEPSINEYSAAIWRYYTTNSSDEEVRSSVLAYAARSGYEGWKEERPASGRAFSARNGEFEIRLHLYDVPHERANFSVSANWYGSER